MHAVIASALSNKDIRVALRSVATRDLLVLCACQVLIGSAEHYSVA